MLSDKTTPTDIATRVKRVSLHLLVLSIFRLPQDDLESLIRMSQCTFWCPVLSDLSSVPDGWSKDRIVSQCTFWCSVPSDTETDAGRILDDPVSMHLLVLSPFRRRVRGPRGLEGDSGLNAPSGAQCFPTRRDGTVEQYIDLSQCTFWCSVLSDVGGLELY